LEKAGALNRIRRGRTSNVYELLFEAQSAVLGETEQIYCAGDGGLSESRNAAQGGPAHTDPSNRVCDPPSQAARSAVGGTQTLNEPEKTYSADASSLATTTAPSLVEPIPAATQAVLRKRLSKEEFESYLGNVGFSAGPPARITAPSSARASFIRKYLGGALDAAFGVHGWEVDVQAKEPA
jgi:hypothetical protein